MRAFDLIVIGSGPAGEKGAAQAAWFGKKVALIERAAPALGGACTNTGTLPSKTLPESALALSGLSQRGLEQAVLSLPKPLPGLAALGVVPDQRGNLAVNEHFQTKIPHIYAAGDVVGAPALASVSMEQGRVAMCHAFQLSYKTWS